MNLNKILLTFVFISMTVFASAQPVTSNANIPPPPIDPDIPITGGLGYLVAAGLGYGLYALKKRKKS